MINSLLMFSITNMKSRLLRGNAHDGPRAEPIFLRIRSSKAFIISACTLALFTDCFLYGIVSNLYLKCGTWLL